MAADMHSSRNVGSMYETMQLTSSTACGRAVDDALWENALELGLLVATLDDEMVGAVDAARRAELGHEEGHHVLRLTLQSVVGEVGSVGARQRTVGRSR